MIFRFKRLLVSISAMSSLLIAVTAMAATGNPRLEQARDYVLYYGGVGDNEMRELVKYNIVIIDPQAMGENAAAKISRLKQNGCLVIGYLSCMEVAEWHRYKDRVPAAWHLKIKDKEWNPWGKNHAVDLTQPQWRKMLTELVKTEVIDYGCDGVFMDTLADIEHPDLPDTLRQQQLVGLDSLLKELRTTYPSLILISNWTIQATLPVAAKYVDVICWENFQPKFFTPGDPAFSFVSGVRKNLNELQRKYHFKVYAIWASPNYYELRDDQRRMAALAASFGYLSYYCIDDYHVSLTPKKK